MYPRYRGVPASLKPKHTPESDGIPVGWADMLPHWPLIELDLHEVYGADWRDPSLVRAWPWWRARILGLLGTRSRLARALTPDPPRQPGGQQGG